MPQIFYLSKQYHNCDNKSIFSPVLRDGYVLVPGPGQVELLVGLLVVTQALQSSVQQILHG